MLTSAQFDECESWLGVPLVFAPEGDWLTTNAPLASARRHGKSDTDARLRRLAGDLERAGLVQRTCDLSIQVDVGASDEWLASCDVPLDVVRQRAARCPNHPLVSRYGQDAAVWAWLWQASKSQELDWGVAGEAWATRSDSNPLALVRRAHASAFQRERVALTLETVPPRPRGADVRLRQQLALVPQAGRQAARTQRTRPLMEQISLVARQVLAHTEQQPVERTDLQAIEAARTLMAKVGEASAVTLPALF